MVDNEELRDAMKENGIGRPSTRAAIIETLFRRQYIRRQRKTIIATPTGIELISLIKEELLKSAELTGLWEKKLRQIEHHEYSAPQFINELKVMVTEVTQSAPAAPLKVKVLADAADAKAQAEKQKATESKPRKRIIRAGSICPKCGQGKVIKGNTAYGCSRWKEGCDWRKPFK